MVNRLWLRATVGIAGAIGLALLAVVTGTYLLAVESDTAAIVAFVFAGVITCAMGAIPWVTLKKLRELGSSRS
ncbi:transmembrane protein [Mycobacteroides abscessus subsp. abscessus]|nr:transmembrane protein [Mycobacteroides abscessus subsp. abscessus]